MEEILAKTLSNPTYTTIIAVVNALLAVIVPQLAKITIVLSSLLAAFPAILRRWLGMSTEHA
jgi:hypothetical protein